MSLLGSRLTRHTRSPSLSFVFSRPANFNLRPAHRPAVFLRMASSSSSPQRSYSAAIQALNTLQSNAATIAATRAAGGKYNDWLIPEMVEYLQRAGHRQEELDRLNVIHITGTKGKGSTAAFSSSLLLKAHGQSQSERNQDGPTVGLFTSPHMLLVRERIRLDGLPISEERFAEAFWHVWDLFDSSSDQRAHPEVTPSRPVYFKFLTVMAFHIFLTTPTLCAIVLEVGIGGRYDSTNIVPHPVACGITTLGMDHQAILGNNIEDIAAQKAGIYKAGCPAISVRQPIQKTERVLQDAAETVGASSFTILPPIEETEIASLRLGLPGRHQLANAQLALALVETYLQVKGPPQSDRRSVWSGSALCPWAREALEQARWPGRCQIVPAQSSGQTTFFLDGAHTTDSLALCTRWFIAGSEQRASGPCERSLIFNCTNGRNAHELLGSLLEEIRSQAGKDVEPSAAATYFSRVLFCTNTTYHPGGTTGGGDLTNKMVDSGELESLTVQKQLRDAWLELTGASEDSVMVLPSVQDALQEIPTQGDSKQQQHVLVAGSLHLVGGVMCHLKNAGALDDKLEALHSP